MPYKFRRFTLQFFGASGLGLRFPYFRWGVLLFVVLHACSLPEDTQRQISCFWPTLNTRQLESSNAPDLTVWAHMGPTTVLKPLLANRDARDLMQAFSEEKRPAES